MAFESIINANEYFSSHYLDSLLQSGLKDQRNEWTAREDGGQPTARSGVRALGAEFFRLRPEAERDHEALRELHSAILKGLSFSPERTERTFTRAANEITVPLCAAVETATGLQLVAIEADFSLDADRVVSVDKEGAKLIGRPWDGEDGDGKRKLMSVGPAELASMLFACEEPPRYVLILAGGTVVLADRAKWGEGKYLAVNIDDALGRNDTKSKGELETIAGLFSADVLIPDGGESTLEKLVGESHKHAVGVSEDLRHGIRESIELLANEVIRQRQAAKLGVYNGEVDPAELTRQCLRYLYRLVFLLFAETRSELGVLPVDHPEYSEGYGLDRLRELALIELQTEQAREGTHIQQSLELLFELINEGYNASGVQATLGAETESQISLTFQPLKSDLFRPGSTPLLRIKLSNAVLQQVLSLLMLSREKRGRAREFVSYSNLGINQLGAVYEGLMSYSGFFAGEDLFEVAKHGDRAKGSWPIPVTDADEFDDSVFVTRDEDGEKVRVLHPKGSFVFLISGYARERSASYYTPNVLTECVVRHALAELLDQDGQRTPAEKILELTICEPALGSGAFLNEAINQLAAEYLSRRQAELQQTLEPADYTRELQKVKAHLALHLSYGVDLNGTAVELAEVSLWLNAMHPGLQAPWFGLHLRRGNSLIGARRALFSQDQLSSGSWLKTAPKDAPLSEGENPSGYIHHFLVPADGWGAVASAKQAKELRPERVAQLKDWKKQHQKLSPDQIKRLLALAERVELLWGLALQRLQIAESELRRPLDIWGAERSEGGVAASEASIREALEDPGSALGRLRLAMDCWCALWYWPLTTDEKPPTADEWIGLLEGLLGVDPAHSGPAQPDLFVGLKALIELEQQLLQGVQMTAIDDLRREHEWLRAVEEIAEREGFFHWELEFAPVFKRGGFDLQVGNPPWMRPRWLDNLVLAELDPWFGIVEKASAPTTRARRETALRVDLGGEIYLDALAAAEGMVQHLSSSQLHPVLTGIQTNLYMLFMEETWRHMAGDGIVAMLHKESHFFDPEGGALRAECYKRLRRHWQFINAAFIFREIGDMNTFGVHIYGEPRNPCFLNIAHVQIPEMIDGSLEHDGSGEPPGLKRPDGTWDRQPHKSRVIRMDEKILASWAELFDEPGSQADQARLLRPVTSAELGALSTLAEQPRRLADVEYSWTAGFVETNAVNDGTIEWKTGIPESWDDVILQGPHIGVAKPFAKQPNVNCRSHQDWSAWDLEALPNLIIPRTNYQRALPSTQFKDTIPVWRGKASSEYWRLGWRSMTHSGLARSLLAAIMPRHAAHVGSVFSINTGDEGQMLRLAAYWASIPIDYMLKVSGVANV